MPRKCCVPGCKSNYIGTGGPHISTFSFPKDEELKKKWLKCIHRKDFSPTENSVVCIIHFSEESIVRHDVLTRSDGSTLVYERKLPKLIQGAIPCIFPHQPSYFTPKPVLKRKTPDERSIEISQRDEEVFKKLCLLDSIASFSDFKSSFRGKYNSNVWTALSNPDHMVFMKLSDEHGCKVVACLKIMQDLSVEIWHEGVLLENSQFRRLFEDGSLCDRYSKFENLLNALNNFENKLPSFGDKISHHLNMLQESIKAETGLSIESKKHSTFIMQQLDITLNKKKYPHEILMWASSLFYSNPSCYKLFRDSGVLSLPHPDYLRKLSLGGVMFNQV